MVVAVECSFVCVCVDWDALMSCLAQLNIYLILFLASLTITIQYARSIYNKNELEQSNTIILIARSFVAILFLYQMPLFVMLGMCGVKLIT